MGRREEIDDAIRRVDHTSAEVNAKVKQMEEGHRQVMDEAAATKTRMQLLERENEYAKWSQDVLQEFSNVQIEHYRKRREILNEVLAREKLQEHGHNPPSES